MDSRRYCNFKSLQRNETEGVDYAIRYRVNDLNVLFLTPHGGGIEPGCSELTIGAAKERYSYYIFEGLKKRNNRILHITSTQYDEPILLQLLQQHEFVVSFHGYHEENQAKVKIGGLYSELKNACYKEFTKKKINAEILSDTDELSGVKKNNITNLGKMRKGLQLELSTKLRNEMFNQNTLIKRQHSQTKQFQLFIECIHNAIQNVERLSSQ